MATFEQTTLISAEERFGEVVYSLIRTLKHEYKLSEKYGELTDGMRRWKFNLKDICPAFQLGRQFCKHLRHGKLMKLWEFVNLMHWMFTLCDDEKGRLMLLMDVCTLLFYHTKEGEENGWHPFSRPLRDLFNEMIEEESERRTNRKLIIRKYQQMSRELDKRA